jgi:polyisoprenoid-binding protein YceI
MRKMTFALIASIPLAIVAPLAAQKETAAPLPGQLDTTRVTAGTYAADPAHTLVGFRVNHFGFNDYFGIFGDASGTLIIDPKKPAASKVDISIPITGLTTANAKLNDHMKSADFLDAAKFSTARFVSAGVKVNGTRAIIAGNLTIKGVTKPVTLDARFTGAGTNPYNKKATVGFEATTVIKRSDFAVNYGIPAVSDKVELTITAAFEKA